MEFVIDALIADWESFLRFVPRLAYAAIVLTGFFVLGRQVGRLVGRLLKLSARFGNDQHFIQQLVTFAVWSLGILLTLGILGFQGIAASLLATGGVVAIVAGFAFREIGENFLAGFFLSFSRPFELQDLIKTGDLTGTVAGIELRHVHIRTFDGCDVYVPSAQIFREPLYNYTRDGLRRPSFSIGVAYQDEPEQVLSLLETAARGVAEVLADPPLFVSIKNFSAQYIEYEVFFWIDVNTNALGLVATRNEVKIRCWRALRAAKMTFSSDVTAGIDIQTAPELSLNVTRHTPNGR